MLDVLRQPDRDAAGHVLHQRRVVDQEAITERLVPSADVVVPQSVEFIARYLLLHRVRLLSYARGCVDS